MKEGEKVSKEGKIVKDLSDKGVGRNSLRKRPEKRKNENSLESCSKVALLSTRWTAVPETSLCCPEGPAGTATHQRFWSMAPLEGLFKAVESGHISQWFHHA